MKWKFNSVESGAHCIRSNQRNCNRRQQNLTNEKFAWIKEIWTARVATKLCSAQVDTHHTLTGGVTHSSHIASVIDCDIPRNLNSLILLENCSDDSGLPRRRREKSKSFWHKIWIKYFRNAELVRPPMRTISNTRKPMDSATYYLRRGLDAELISDASSSMLTFRDISTIASNWKWRQRFLVVDVVDILMKFVNHSDSMSSKTNDKECYGSPSPSSNS